MHGEPGPQTLQSCGPGSSAGLWAAMPCREAPWCCLARCPEWRSLPRVPSEPPLQVEGRRRWSSRQWSGRWPWWRWLESYARFAVRGHKNRISVSPFSVSRIYKDTNELLMTTVLANMLSSTTQIWIHYTPRKNFGFKAESKWKLHFVLPKIQKHADKRARTVSV